MQSGFVVWFTGLSGAGKSTLASLVAAELRARGVRVEVLDGDEVRTHLSRGLGFSREDRDINVRRIGFVAKLVARAGACAITAAISPYRATRDEQRQAIGRFVEVYLRCPVPVLARRDPKGLYEKALAGQIQHFTGIDDPYEAPTSPELELDTSTLTSDECVSRILETIERLGFIAPRSDGGRENLVRPYGELPILARTVEPKAPHSVATPDGDVVRWLASGLLAPIHGPLGAKDRTRIEKEGRLERGLRFDVAPAVRIADATGVVPGDRIALTETGSPSALATMDVDEVFSSPAPGDGTGTVFVAGRLLACELPEAGLALRTRVALHQLGGPVAGLFTERPLHRGDVYLCRAALERFAALVVVVANGSPHVRAAIRAALSADLAEKNVHVIAMPPLPGDAKLLAPMARAIALQNLGIAEIIAREDDEPLFRAVEESGRELDVVVRPPVETLSLPSGAIYSARTIPKGVNPAVSIEWRAIETLLDRGERPSSLVMAPGAVDVLLNARSPGEERAR